MLSDKDDYPTQEYRPSVLVSPDLFKGLAVPILSSEDPNFDSHFNLLTCAYRYSGNSNTIPYIRCEKWAEVKQRVNSHIFKGAYVNV